MRRGIEFSRATDINQFRNIYPQMEIKGKEKVGDRETFVVEAIPTVGTPEIMYFDTQTGLLLRQDFVFESQGGQKNISIPVKVFIEDFIEINGIKMPLVTHQVSPGFSLTFRYYFNSIKVNVPIDDSKFRMPKEASKSGGKTSENSEQARLLYLQCKEQNGLEDYDQAIALCTKAIEFNPLLAAAYSERSAAYYFKEQYDLALSDIKKAIDIEPIANNYSLRGGIYMQKGKFDLALADFNKAIDLAPEYAHFYNIRCVLYLDKFANYNKALEDCSKAIKLMESPIFYRNRAAVFERLKRKDLAEADRKKAKMLESN